MEQHQICDRLFDKTYISFLIKFKIRKNIWIQSETVSSMGTGKQFYILLRLAITRYCP